MKTNAGFMPKNVSDYVFKGTNMVNLVLLLFTISNAILFWIYDATFLFYFDCVKVLLIILAWFLLGKGKVKAYIFMIFGGIFVFMILSVIYLGWDYGFQQYCIGFVASLIFTDFYMSRERKVTKRTIALVAFNVLLYIALRLWTYEHPCVYVIDNKLVVRIFYIMNSLIGFAFLIMYSLIYSKTVSKLENALLEMANVDPLTGICNRRRMQQMLKLALEENESQQNHTVLAMLDVDYFKKVNDTYGHDAGDDVLVSLAGILREKQAQDEGFHVSRWGGEEFLVFYEAKMMTKEDVVREFDELRIRIQDTVVRSKTQEISITVTIGLAFYEKGEKIHGLIKRADDNLYEGKKQGRNRIVY